MTLKDWLDDLLRDVRFGVRQFSRMPGFTVTALLTIALGVGANAAIFSAVYGVLLRPLPYREADRLVVSGISLPDYDDLKREAGVFAETAVWGTNQYNIDYGGETQQVPGAVVSEDFFTVLGVAALAGRTFTPADGREPVAVISTRLWKERLGGDASVIGRPITLSGTTHTIVGVAPASLQLPTARTDVWVPLGHAMGAAAAQLTNRSLRIFRLIGRLPDGGTMAQAQAQVNALGARLAAAHPRTNPPDVFVLASLQQRITGDVTRALWILQGAVALLLLIAGANVANLLLARDAARGREIAIRTALGAGRGRVARQLLIESLVLAATGGALGTLLAGWSISALPRLVGDRLPRVTEVTLDLPVLVFTLGASLVAGVLFGMTPIVQLAWRGEGTTLKEGSRGVIGGGQSRRVRGVLVAAEIALSLVVLIGAGLLARSFVRLLATDVGFEAERLLTFNVQLVKLGSAEERARAALALIDRLRALPGAESAGAATGLAPVIAQRGTRFEAEGDRSTDVRSSYWIAATPTYFEAIGAPIRAGRAFDDRDTSTAPKVVIINRALAERLFGSEPAVGRRVRIVNPEQSAEWRTIVGISPDVKYGGLDGTGDATIYTPFQQTPFLWAYVVVRTRAPDPLTLGRAVRSAVAEVDPRLTAASYQSAGTLIAESVGRQRFVMLFASSFALIALVLAAVGIYGVVSYGVAQRTSEISLRMALGARAGLIVRMFLREAAVLALAGVGAGLVGAYAATRAMSTLLFEVTPTDPATFALVSTGLVLVALAACLVPAWRATRCSPVEALSKGTG